MRETGLAILAEHVWSWEMPLVARFLYSLLKRGVTIKTGARVRALIVKDGTDSRRPSRTSLANVMNSVRLRGVVLAAGGFTHHPHMRAELLPQPTAQYSVVPSDNEGDGVDLGLQAGGHIGQTHANNAYWAPSSGAQPARRHDSRPFLISHWIVASRA